MLTTTSRRAHEARDRHLPRGLRDPTRRTRSRGRGEGLRIAVLHRPHPHPSDAADTQADAGDPGWGAAALHHNYDPLVAIAYAAAATQTLRLGTGVHLVPQREPIATAKALASLDVLSHGRVLFGVGVGWIPEEIANHGIDPPTRWAVMDERVQAMRAIWTQDEAQYHGRHVDFGPIWSWPKPKQRPHPPILVGGAGKGVIRRVLAYGDEWMPHAGMPVEQLGARIQELQHAARTA
ncbi:MAG TPA: TIGR03619 family F420-dependent LLM class oxidoreductase, partial [Baekduia sp.]|nr:TIGR03619 family F420-dependent LLM class oxidoreductase [Baekduia sp.]